MVSTSFGVPMWTRSRRGTWAQESDLGWNSSPSLVGYTLGPVPSL